MAGRSVHEAADSGATMSRRLIRHGVPLMTPRQPSHRVATLSLTIVRIWTPMISIAPIVAEPSDGYPDRGLSANPGRGSGLAGTGRSRSSAPLVSLRPQPFANEGRMKAFALIGADQPAALVDLPDPEVPAEGGVLIRARAASVNGFDVFEANGYLVPMMPHDFPVIVGRDVAGVVEAVGDGTTDVAVGDRVMGFIPSTPPLHRGTWSELVPAGPDVVITPMPAGAVVRGRGCDPPCRRDRPRFGRCGRSRRRRRRARRRCHRRRRLDRRPARRPARRHGHRHREGGR